MENKNNNKFEFLLNKKIEEGINQVAKYFESARFTVTIKAQKLIIYLGNSPKFKLKYIEEEYYFKRNQVNENEKYLAKIEVSFDNLNEVLGEYSTMQEIQEILLDHFDGIIFLKWNQGIIE